MIAARFFVSGRVQGVGFRASARQRALALGLAGFARNLADGRVETLAQGGADDVEAYAQWLRLGPSFARVDDVRREAAEVDPELRGFGYG